MSTRHPLLRRQLTRAFGAESCLPPELAPLVDAVEAAYRQSDADRGMLERSLELSSQELLQANAELRGMLQAFPDTFFRLQSDGTILEQRGSDPRGRYYTGEALIGRRLQDMLEPEMGRKLDEALAAVRATAELVSVEQLRLEGAEGHFEARLVPMPGGEVMVLVRDITQQRQAELQLLQAQKMEAVGRLAGGIAHDFNNLLTMILGYSELVAVAIADPNLRNDVEEIRRAGERAAELTRRLLAFSRKQVTQPRILSLNQVVSGVASMLQRLLGADVRMAIHLEPELARVRADAGQLEQVLVNLAVNSRDAMPSGGQLTLKTGNLEVGETTEPPGLPMPPGRYVLLEVADDGSGMDAETASRAFEPFFTTKETGKGTGLGLSMVYGTVKQSGGFVWLNSLPHRGTSVRILLPAVDAPLDPRPVKAPSHCRHGRGHTILVVDDEPALRALVRTVLSAAGYEVLEACCATEAMRLSERHGDDIDLLLTDVVLPDLNGTQVAQSIVRHRPKTRVLFMSGYTDAALRIAGVAERPELLPKPFTPSVLLDRVSSVLLSETAA